MGSVVVAHRFSHPMACGIFPDQGSTGIPGIAEWSPQGPPGKPPKISFHLWLPVLILPCLGMVFCLSCLGFIEFVGSAHFFIKFEKGLPLFPQIFFLPLFSLFSFSDSSHTWSGGWWWWWCLIVSFWLCWVFLRCGLFCICRELGLHSGCGV